MATKIGAGGHRQNYDPRTGRYAKTTFPGLVKLPPTRKEKAQRREELRRLELFNRAKKSRDKYVFEVYLAIENELPGEVCLVNDFRFDTTINNVRELDIVTKKCIIEIKGGTGSRNTHQLLAQKRFAEMKKKQHVLFAPEISYRNEGRYKKHGIEIKRDIKTLIQFIKENKQ